MAFIKISDIAKTKRAPRSTADLSFSTDKAGTHNGEQKYQIRLKLSEALFKAARMGTGDPVEIEFDPETGKGKLSRVESGTFRLHKNGKGSQLCVAVMWRPGLPSIVEQKECQDISVSPSGIFFTFPEGTSFNGNARQKAAA